MHEFLWLKPQALPPRRFATEDSIRMRLTFFEGMKFSAIGLVRMVIEIVRLS